MLRPAPKKSRSFSSVTALKTLIVCPSGRTWRRHSSTAAWCRPLKSGSALFLTNLCPLSGSERSCSGYCRRWALNAARRSSAAFLRFSRSWCVSSCSCPAWVRRRWSTAASGGPSCSCTNIPKSLEPTKTSLSNSSVRPSSFSVVSLSGRGGRSFWTLSHLQTSGRGRSSVWRRTIRGWRERSGSREIWISRCLRDGA